MFTLKPTILLLLLNAGQCLGGAHDNIVNTTTNAAETAGIREDDERSANLIARGDWSEPVKDYPAYVLRGRLLVYQGYHDFRQFGTYQEVRRFSPVYLELQDVSPARHDQPMGIFIDPADYFVRRDGLNFELRDSNGKLAARPGAAGSFSSPLPYWATVPPGGSVRLRVDGPGGYSPITNGFTLSLTGMWQIPVDDTNEYFLYGSFTPPTNNSRPLDVHAWHGTLTFPPLQIVPPSP